MFIYPSALIALFIIPLAMLFFVWRTHARRAALRRIGDATLIVELTRQISSSRRRWKSTLWLLTIAALTIALARPVWGISEEITQTEGIAIVVVLDVSKSMDAQDIAPSRLERAKLDAQVLFEQGQQNEVGLVLFAGNAFAQFPLTAATDTAVIFLRAAGPDSISRQGTALEEALSVAMEMTDERIAQNSVIILLTDGENHEGDPVRAATEAAERGIIIHVIGYGTPEGAPIPQYDASGQLIGHKADRAGNIVVTHLEETVLAQLAAATNGLYQRATDSDIEVINLLNEIAGMQRDILTRRSQTRKIERFSVFVALAVFTLTLEIFLPETRKLRDDEKTPKND